MPVHISQGNSKLGNIPNISLPPGPAFGCRKDAPCFKGCYAWKAWRQYPQVRTAWTENWLIYRASPMDYFGQIRDYLAHTRKAFFRWHVAGDIPDFTYLVWMGWLARQFPGKYFLAHTKRTDLLFDHEHPANLPENVTLRQSMWPGWLPEFTGLPKSWMQDGTEDRVPMDAFECPGHCESCYACWYKDVPGVVIKFH